MLNQDKGKYWCRRSLHSIYQYNGSSGNNEKETVHNEMKYFLNECFYFSKLCDFTLQLEKIEFFGAESGLQYRY